METKEIQLGESGRGQITKLSQTIFPFEEKVSLQKKYVTIKQNKPRLGGNSKDYRAKNANDYFCRGFKMPDTDYWLGTAIRIKEDGTYQWKM